MLQELQPVAVMSSEDPNNVKNQGCLCLMDEVIIYKKKCKNFLGPDTADLVGSISLVVVLNLSPIRSSVPVSKDVESQQ